MKRDEVESRVKNDTEHYSKEFTEEYARELSEKESGFFLKPYLSSEIYSYNVKIK